MPFDVPLPTPSVFVDRWTNYEVPVLAQILAGDLEDGFERALAWGTVGGIMRDAADSLARVVSVLSETWDPVVDQAAHRFVQEAEILVARLRSVADDAASNKPIVNRAVTSFESSRSEVLRLHDEWVVREAEEQGSVFRDGALAGERSGEWRDSYNARAYEVLQRSDAEAFQEARALVAPSKEQREPLTTDPIDDPIQGGSNGSHLYGGGRGLDPGGGIVRPGTSTDSNLPPVQDPSIDTHASSRNQHSMVENDISLPVIGGAVATGELGAGVLGRGRRYANVAGDSRRRGSNRQEIENGTNRLQGRPNEDGAPPGPLNDRGRNDQYPVGGVPLTGALVPPTQNRRRSARQRNSEGEPWRMAAGVPGVLMPDLSEPNHDPGKGVIGIDR
jgi:hypothetical protein